MTGHKIILHQKIHEKNLFATCLLVCHNDDSQGIGPPNLYLLPKQEMKKSRSQYFWKRKGKILGEKLIFQVANNISFSTRICIHHTHSLTMTEYKDIKLEIANITNDPQDGSVGIPRIHANAHALTRRTMHKFTRARIQ